MRTKRRTRHGYRQTKRVRETRLCHKLFSFQNRLFLKWCIWFVFRVLLLINYVYMRFTNPFNNNYMWFKICKVNLTYKPLNVHQEFRVFQADSFTPIHKWKTYLSPSVKLGHSSVSLQFCLFFSKTDISVCICQNSSSPLRGNRFSS